MPECLPHAATCTTMSPGLHYIGRYCIPHVLLIRFPTGEYTLEQALTDMDAAATRKGKTVSHNLISHNHVA